MQEESCEPCQPTTPKSCLTPGKLVMGTHIKTATNRPCAPSRCGRESRQNCLLSDAELINKYGRDSSYCIEDDFKIIRRKTPRCKPVTCNTKKSVKESACVTAACLKKACKKAMSENSKAKKKEKCKKRPRKTPTKAKFVNTESVWTESTEGSCPSKKYRSNENTSCSTGCEQPSIDMALTSVVDVMPEPLRSMALDKKTKRVECFGDNCMIM